MKKKYTIVLGSIAATVTTATAITLPLAINSHLSKTNKFKSIHLFNRTFSSRESLIQYALQTANVFTAKNGESFFSLEDSGERLFTNSLELRKYIAKNISRIQIRNSVKIQNKDLDPADNSLAPLSLNNLLASNGSSFQRYYRGIKNTIFDSRLKAIESYFQYHKVFRYNNITFRNKEELKRYLYKNYNNLDSFNPSASNNIQSPSGLISNFYDFNTKLGRAQARKFVENTATSLIGIRNKNDSTYNYINQNDILNNSLNNNFYQSIPLNQINVVHIKANNGNALWITDSSKEDSANFYGKYFTKSMSDEITQISNPKNWTKQTEGMQGREVIKKSKNSDAIGKFFAILNKLSAYFNLDLNNQKALSHTQEVEHVLDVPKYKKILESQPKYKEIVEHLRKTSKILAQGSRYNALYELPILYTQLLSNANEWGLKNQGLNFFRRFFQTIADDYQDILESLFPKNALVDRKGHSINIASIFGINDSSFNIDSTPEFQLYKLAESPKFVRAIKIFMDLIVNKTTKGGAKSFYVSSAYSKYDSNNEYYLRLWTLLSGNLNDIHTPGKKDEEVIADILNKSLSTKQSNFLLKLMKVNDKILKTNNELVQKFNASTANKIIKRYSHNGMINLNSIGKDSPTSHGVIDEDVFKEFIKIKNILKSKYKNQNKVKVFVFNNLVKQIAVRDIFKNNMRESLAKKQPRFQSKAFLAYNFNDAKVSFNKKLFLAKKASVTLNSIAGLRDGLLSATNLVEAIQADDLYSAFKSISSLFSAAAMMASAFPLASVGLEVLSFAMDFISEIIGKQEKNIFKFQTTENNSEPFYWDGGRTTTRFWGLQKTTDVGKESMKIVHPIKITNGSQKDYWIYNGQKFTDENELRKQALLDFARGDNDAILLGNGKFLKRAFTYEKMVSNQQLPKGVLVSATKKELSEKLIPFMSQQQSITLAPINNYFKSTQFSLIGGKIAQAPSMSGTSQPEIKKANIKQLLFNIRPSLIVQLPKTKNGIPIDQFSNSIISNEKYELPGQKYYENGIVHARTSPNPNHYLEINLNELQSQGSSSQKSFKYSSVSKGIEELWKNFIKNIGVKSIYAMRQQFLTVNKFSDLNSPQESNIFKARGTGGETKYFTTFSDAFKWLISKNEFNMKLIIQKGQNDKVAFNGMVFNNTKELVDYLDELLKKVGK